MGGLTTGVVDWRMESHRSHARAKAGARLLRADLSITQERLKAVLDELLWWPFYDIRMEPWDHYNDVMAGELDADTWGVVSQSAIELQELGEKIRRSPRYDEAKPMSIGNGQVPSLIVIRANAIRAFNALGKLADDEEEMPSSDPPEAGDMQRGA